MEIKIIKYLLAFSAVFYMVSAFAQETAHLHHIHMNVGSIEETTEFYEKVFGVLAVKYNNQAPALMMERSFLFLDQMPRADIKNHQLTGLTHASWGAVDGKETYDRLKAQGVEFYSPLKPLLEGSTYMYLYGPDREVIEIFDLVKHHRFNHIHLLANPENLAETGQWFYDNLNIKTEMAHVEGEYFNLNIDTVAFSIFAIGARFTPKENTGVLENTDGSHLDHVAFSFRDLDAAYERIKNSGTNIERPITVDKKYGVRHFFSRAPNGVLVEFVEASPWPDAAWE